MFYDKIVLFENQYHDIDNKLYFKIWPNDNGGVPHIHICSDAIPSSKSKFKCCICLTDNISYPHGIYTDKITEDRCDSINDYFQSKASNHDKTKIEKEYGIKCDTMYDIFRVLWNVGQRTQFISYDLEQPIYDQNIKRYQDCDKNFHLNTIDKAELNEEIKNKRG